MSLPHSKSVVSMNETDLCLGPHKLVGRSWEKGRWSYMFGGLENIKLDGGGAPGSPVSWERLAL